MNEKIKIIGSEYADANLTNSVCSHLQPFLEYFETQGLKLKKFAPLQTDKGGAHTLKIKLKIDFNAIRKDFEIPRFIDLSEEYHSIICRKCWCDIEGI